MPLPLVPAPPLVPMAALAPLPALPALHPLAPLPALHPVAPRPLPAGVPIAPYMKSAQAFNVGFPPFLSMMMPLLVLPKLLEDPGRVIAGFTLRPLLQGNQFSQLMRSMLLNGADPKERDQDIRDMVLPTALFTQAANAVAQAVQLKRTAGSFRNEAASEGG